MSGYSKYNYQPVAKKVESIYKNRLALFTANGEYKDYNLPAVLEHGRVREGHVKLEVWSVPDVHARPSFKEAVKNQFREARVGEKFGPSWATHWFKVQIQVPKEWSKAQDVLFNWNCGNEGLIFTEDGRVVVGLSGEERREWILPASFKDGNWHTFYVEAACNGMFGNADPNYNIMPPIDDRFFDLETADLVWPNTEARALKADYLVIVDAAKNFDEKAWQKHKAIEVANAIIDAFDHKDLDSIKKCREIAKEFLGDKVDSADVYKSEGKGLVFGVGHCHIDTAWLWPYAETRRKIGRSWATQLDLIERYPEYNFVCSQAVQYQWLMEDYPELFERLKKQVKAGRFIPVGGSWVENDGNLPSGEAVARQFLYGQRFFEAHFGIRCKTFWLPDTFGYSAQLPQLSAGGGCDRFLTQKLSWNNINNFQNTTFNWVALDGSQVVCHMPPADTYNSMGNIEEIQRSVEGHKNAGIDQSSLLLFGFGDGGGGPTPDMLERLRRARGITDTVGHLPRVSMGGDVDTYFDNVIETTGNGKKLVSWVGELYFEFHRGTYTTQANTKKGNRESEVLLHDLEYVCALVSAYNKEYKYPKAELDKLWGDLLLNQFHDVLPGSSIGMVYVDAENIYDEIRKGGLELLKKALDVSGSVADGQLVALNTLPWARSEIVKVPASFNVADDPAAVQTTSDGDLFVRFSSDGAGVMSVDNAMTAHKSSLVHVSEKSKGVFVLENAKLRATIEGSHVTGLYDLENKREILTKGAKGNHFVLFEDQPLNWQGWDTEVYSLNKRQDLEIGTAKILEEGPLRASVLVEQQISDKSWIKTTISLDAHNANSPYAALKFDTEVEWRENCRFLKVEFPVDVHSESATYDTMYGCVKRPTHYNTFYDVAKFEVCCHKYADLSDYTYGVTVLNNSKYGFATHGSVMRLSLLRAAKAPDADADMGRHHISYAIVGHAGQLNADIVRLAQNFNHPLRMVPAGINADPFTAITYEGPKNVILSAVKRAEDDADVSTGDLPVRNKGSSLVVRLYDSLGGRTSGKLVSKLKIVKAWKTNLLEDDLEEVAVEDGSIVPVELRAFEIATFRLQYE